jgi:hypothetical protein
MPDLTRRAILAAPLVALPNARPLPPSLAEDVATYVGIGEHRAGTAGERTVGRWLQGRLARLGYGTRVEHFPVLTVLNPGGTLHVAGEAIRAFPQWLPPADVLGKTIAHPLELLDAESGDPAIRVVAKPIAFTPNWMPSLDKLVQLAAAKRAPALIVAIDSPSGELFACNQHSRAPFPIPVALVARNDLPRITNSIGRSARLRLTGALTETQALNVIGEKTGIGQRLVVSTPLTGWFTCGGERGPGIALWLRLAAFLAASKRPVTLLGTGSHEIGHFGMEHALANGAPKPDDVALWLHFGASLAATKLDAQYGKKSPQYLVARSPTEGLAKTALLSDMPIYLTGDRTTLGEAGQIIGAGHEHFVGLSGSFPTFHTPKDMGQAIDYVNLERIAQSSIALMRSVSGDAYK